jgi:hypothetical protein
LLAPDPEVLVVARSLNRWRSSLCAAAQGAWQVIGREIPNDLASRILASPFTSLFP